MEIITPEWIYEGNDCPPPKGVDSKQIPEQHIECDASVLSFVDKNNGKARTLTYQLNFEDSKGRPVTPLDPQIKNGGGTGGFVSYLLPLAGGIALLGLAYVAYEAFFEQ